MFALNELLILNQGEKKQATEIVMLIETHSLINESGVIESYLSRNLAVTIKMIINCKPIRDYVEKNQCWDIFKKKWFSQLKPADIECQYECISSFKFYTAIHLIRAHKEWLEQNKEYSYQAIEIVVKICQLGFHYGYRKLMQYYQWQIINKFPPNYSKLLHHCYQYIKKFGAIGAIESGYLIYNLACHLQDKSTEQLRRSSLDAQKCFQWVAACLKIAKMQFQDPRTYWRIYFTYGSEGLTKIFGSLNINDVEQLVIKTSKLSLTFFNEIQQEVEGDYTSWCESMLATL